MPCMICIYICMRRGEIEGEVCCIEVATSQDTLACAIEALMDGARSNTMAVVVAAFGSFAAAKGGTPSCAIVSTHDLKHYCDKLCS